MSKPKQTINVEVSDQIIKELLTESELRMVKQRIAIIKLLERELSIRAVAKRAKVGSDTVVRTSRIYKASSKLKNYFGKKPELPKSAPKWVFGSIKMEEEQ